MGEDSFNSVGNYYKLDKLAYDILVQSSGQRSSSTLMKLTSSATVILEFFALSC